MIETLPISNFNSLLEIFIVFNLTYVSIEGVNQFVNCKIFGLDDRQNTLFSKIDVLIVDIATQLKNHLDPGIDARYVLASENLISLKSRIPEKIHKVQSFFRLIYLIGGFYTLILLLLAGIDNNDSTLIIIKTLSFLTALTLIVFSLIGIRLKIPRNIMFLTLLLFLFILTVSITFGILNIKWFVFFPKILSLVIPLVPFIFNYFGSLYLYRLLKLDFKDIKKIIDEPYNHNIFSKRLDFLLRESPNPHKFKILEAKYGANNSFIDVAAALNSLIKCDHIYYNGKYNDIFTDPVKDVEKSLSLKYSFNGKNHSLTLVEDAIINLP